MTYIDNKITKGEYLCFLDGNNQVGGAIFWNRDEKNNNIFWTSCWWLFKKVLTVKVELYIIKNDALELVNVLKKVELDISHTIVLNKELKGTIRIISM